MSLLARLHEDYIEKARRPTTFSDGLPVKPVSPDVPVIVTNKWVSKDGRLFKTYRFREVEERNLFVKLLLDHEQEVRHNARITVDEDYVDISVWTKDVNSVTELDKEYAKHADSVYKEVLYSTSDLKYNRHDDRNRR
jgi:pterin-4a-carbinolamine dehydratase